MLALPPSMTVAKFYDQEVEATTESLTALRASCSQACPRTLSGGAVLHCAVPVGGYRRRR
jgi:hypothetical protein